LFTDGRLHDFYRAEACLTPTEARNSDGFAPPPLGAEVWMEFERGDPDYPVWTGCLWVRG
jgi:hypothetical protein